jgi:integrase
MPKKPELKWGTKRCRGRIWWVGYYVVGEQCWESTHSIDEGDADALLLKRCSELNTGMFRRPVLVSLTIGRLLDAVMEDYQLNNRATTSISTARSMIKHHLEPHLGLLPVSRFCQESVRLLRQYMMTRKSEGAAVASINMERRILHRAFSLAKELGDVTTIPQFPKAMEGENIRKGFFEYEEFVRMRGGLPSELRPVAEFAFWTGCRKNEILQLRWVQVSLVDRIIRLEPGETKNDEARAIPLTESIFQVLALQKDLRDLKFPGTPWVFFRHEDGRRIKYFGKAWIEACKRAGLVTKGDDGKERAERLFHDLRRSGIRNLVRAGVPEKVVMLISGHKSRSVFERYNIVDERDLHWAAGKLDRYIQEIRAQQEEQPTSVRVPANDDTTMTLPGCGKANLLN